MISPEDIREKALRKYRDVLRAHVRGGIDSLFPMLIRGNRTPGKSVSELAKELSELRAHSKEEKGFGYEIEWEERQSRQFGKNPFPKKIAIPTSEDFFKLIGKQAEFLRFIARVETLLERFPELEPWLESHIMRVIKSEPDWEGIIEVLSYFRDHPAPGVFARELPLSVDSKFIENHQSELRPLLELILPEGAIDQDETEFDRRFGLRPYEALIRMRFLDPDLQLAARVEQEEFGLPVDQLSGVDWPIRRVIIVENSRCLSTLPLQPGTGTLGLLGHGYRVANFRRLAWMPNCEIFYWGDIDAQGFEILSLLREHYPRTKSFGMDAEVFEKYAAFISTGTKARNRPPYNLTQVEWELSERCRNENLRLEQERVYPGEMPGD